VRQGPCSSDGQALIEGHTDSKGSREANLAMGERRAKAAANFLLKQGVADTRLWTVSHGSDRPVCQETTDACAAIRDDVAAGLKGNPGVRTFV
jgi:peptidoglycan-associated lipoprotein